MVIKILFFLFLLPVSLYADRPPSGDSPLGKVEFVSRVKHEIMVSGFSHDPPDMLLKGDAVYVKNGGAPIIFRVQEISGRYFRCRAEKEDVDFSPVKEGMTVFDHSELNRRAPYHDVKLILRRLVRIYERFIIDIDSADSAPLVAGAMERFTRDLDALIPEMDALNRKYPELKNFDTSTPPELAAEAELLKRIEPRLNDSFYKIRDFASHDEVNNKIEELGKVLQKMRQGGK